MSTRSGKRIHGSIHENVVDVREVKSERKTRGKRQESFKEVATEKKRKHFVRYPSEEDLAAASNVEKIPTSTRKTQRNTLKEQNIATTDSETSNDDRSARRTRRTRQTEAINGTENIDPGNELSTRPKHKIKSKSMVLNEENTIEPAVHPIKKKSNKKKKRKSGSLIVEDIPQTNDQNNLSKMSVDSFHSAAGSPIKEYNDTDNTNTVLDMPSKSTRSHDTVHGYMVKNVKPQDVPSKPTKSYKSHEKVEENYQEIQEMFLKADRNNVDRKYDDEDSNQIQDMPMRATRSKKQSVKNLTLEDVDVKKINIKEKRGKRKLTIEKTDNNNSLTKTANNEDVCNSSKIGINIPIIQITDVNNITKNEKHTDSFNNSPIFNHSLKNFNKKKSKISSDKVDNLSAIEIETVNIKTPDILKKLDTTKANSAKTTPSDDKSNVSGKNLNISFDEKVSNNSVNQTDQQQNILTKGTNNSLKKVRRLTYDVINDPEVNVNVTFDKEITNDSNNHSKYLQNDSTYENINLEKTTIVNTSNEKEIIDTSDNQSDYLIKVDTTNLKNTKKCNKNKKKSSYDRVNFSEISLNATFDKEIPEEQSEESQNILKSSFKNSDKKIRRSIRKSIIPDEINTSIINLDATFEKARSSLTESTMNNMHEIKSSNSTRFSNFSLNHDASSNLNATFDKSFVPDSQPNSHNNSIFDKSAKCNTTFEMVKNTKLDVTFDKSQNNDVRRGSSLISSDTTDNVSSETSKDISRISITSDESMADNIVNTTPVLIESSMDESRINISSDGVTKTTKLDAVHKNVTTFEGTGEEDTSKTSPKIDEILTDIETSKTLLKREGTFTEIKYATPPKREGEKTKNKGSTPKDKGTLKETKGPNTPTREGTYTEFKPALTPLKREGTYTELNPTTTPFKDNATSKEDGPITPLKLNELLEGKHATPPLKREDTFIKDSDVQESPKVQFNVNKTPTRRKSLPSPGRTPFPISKSASKEQEINEKRVLNVTRSIEKSRRSSMADFLPRAKSKVMFCSPVDTPLVTGQMKGKIIKSNLKGSDKSFIFDESGSESARPPRKRSYTQSEAEGIISKRKRLTEGQQQSVERLSRPRTSSASGKLQDPETPSKRASSLNKSKSEVSPSKAKPEGRVLRTRLPNFSALHQKHFAKMESLDECQERKAKRARQLLTPTAPINVLDRVSPKDKQPSPSPTEPQPEPKKPERSIIPPENKGYSRFGFKLDLNVNPFSFPAKTETKPKVNKESRLKPLKRHSTSVRLLPSRAGATNMRKEVAKQAILREKSFTDRRDITRNENRTVIKGVRTNRRFELQMQMRNVK